MSQQYDTVIEGNEGYWTLDAWDEMADDNLPIAIRLTSRNAPWGTGPTWGLYDSTHPEHPDCAKPWQLAYAFAVQYSLSSQVDYVLCDIEPSHVGITNVDLFMAEIAEMCTGAYAGGVTGYPFRYDIEVPQSEVQSWGVWFGNYGCHRYPEHEQLEVPYDPTAHAWNQQPNANVIGRHEAFIDNGFNVLMPVTYVTDTDIWHTNGNHWSGVQCPTDRAAYMWASIEKLSMAIREEMAHGDLSTKKVIPWVNPYGDKTVQTPAASPNVAGWMPPPADFLAIIKHERLRGADGFYYFNGAFDDPQSAFAQENWFAYDEEEEEYLNPWFYENVEWADGVGLEGKAWFEANAIISWEELDGEFADDAVPYRLETDKTSPAMVSAMNDKGHLCIFVSYMDDPRTNIDIDAYFPEARDYTGVSPTQYLSVSAYSHTYTANFFTPDIDGDGDADCDDVDIYLAMWTTADPLADWNLDTNVDNDDVVLFATAWSAMSGGMWCQ